MTIPIQFHPLRDDRTIQAVLQRLLIGIKETQDKIDKMKHNEEARKIILTPIKFKDGWNENK